MEKIFPFMSEEDVVVMKSPEGKEKCVRGDVVKGYISFIKKRWGESGLYEWMDHTGMDPKHISRKDWYDAEIALKTHKWVTETKGPEYAEKMGRDTFKNLGLLSYLLHFADVKTLLEKATKNYKNAFNFGTVGLKLEDHTAEITFKDVSLSPELCRSWLGCFKGMLDVTNTKGRVKELQCQHKGAETCLFLMEWE